MPCLFPNLYTFIVARPGLGKDLAINTAADLIREADRIAREAGGGVIRLGGESISHKGLYDKLGQEASKLHVKWSIRGDHFTANIHSLMFCIGELGTVMPEYDAKLIPVLNDLYNCKSSLEDTIRGQEVRIENPHLVLLLGNQPQTLSEVVSDRHFRMGFTSRVVFVFEDADNRNDMYGDEGEPAHNDDLRRKLVADLIEISKLSGQFDVHPDVQSMANEFNRERPGEVPGIRFVDYNTRRPLHAHKVALCLAAAEGNSRNALLPHHWNRALDLLTEVEQRMPLIFEHVTSARGFSEDINEIKRMTTGQPVTIAKLTDMLACNRPPHEVSNIIRLLKENGTLISVEHPDGRLVTPPTVRLREP